MPSAAWTSYTLQRQLRASATVAGCRVLCSPCPAMVFQQKPSAKMSSRFCGMVAVLTSR